MVVSRMLHIVLFAVLLFAAPAWAASIAPPTVTPEAGKTYFTRMTFHAEDGAHLATNYARGTLWPINTEVKLLKIKGKKSGSFVLQRVDTGEKIKVENVPEYTQIDTLQLASRMLAGEKTPVDKLSKEFADAVKSGQLRLGMPREVAILARGYPPVHKTPALDADKWIYWESRFVTLTIVFKDGVISQGRGLR